MVDRRDLTERNRENQRPIPPIDFCQGLPFKVRWMGRDPQTGRDLVQFPDGSIVRAGKRIFSGNCPRGTMVDVVDCGANGFITIDWRDAEIREPQETLSEVPKDWWILIDTMEQRFYPSSHYLNYPGDTVTYLKNIKQSDKVLLFMSPEIVSSTPVFAGIPDSIFYDSFSDQERLDALKTTIDAHDQLWINCQQYGASPEITDLIAKSEKSIFFIANYFYHAIADQILAIRLGENAPSFVDFHYPPSREVLENLPRTIIESEMRLENDPFFENVSVLPSGAFNYSEIDVKQSGFKIIGREYTERYETWQMYLDGGVSTSPALFDPPIVDVIAVLRQ